MPHKLTQAFQHWPLRNDQSAPVYAVSPFIPLVASVCLGIGLLSPPNAQAARPLGIDTSHWNGTINWTSVHNAGKVFAFTKATESINFTDSTLSKNMTDARAAGLLIGCYHFGRPEYGNSATAEANYFVSVAGQYMVNGYLPPVLDLETGSGLGATALSSWVNTFCNRVKTLTGVSPIIYTSTSYATYYLNSTVTNWTLWVAQWPYFPNPQNGQPYSTGVWPTWAFWQYSSTGMVAGVSGNCDEDVFNGTLAELNNHVIGGGGEPPTLTQQPISQIVFSGGTTGFTVGATGTSPLRYQWQKNNVNLSNGGHYSGCTTNTLTITSANGNDVASYQCIVTNAYGSTNSMMATLELAAVNPCAGIVNADFESGFNLAGGGYIADNWTEWEADPGAVTGYNETDITHGGAHSQRIRIFGGTGGSAGGVYQRVPVTFGQSYTVSVWIYAGDTSSSCYLGVDPSGGTNANTGVTWSSVTTSTAWVQKSWTGTATGNSITVYYKVASTDSNKRNGYFDDATPAAASGPLLLLAQRNGNTLTLTWPECPNAQLQRAESFFEPTSWTLVTNQVSLNGDQKSVTLTLTGNAGFFRLIQE